MKIWTVHTFMTVNHGPCSTQKKLFFLSNDGNGLTVCELFTQGAMPQARRDQIHNQRLPLLQPGFDLQRRGCRRYRARERERHKDWLDEHESQLGSKLAVKRSFCWSVIVLQGHRQ